MAIALLQFHTSSCSSWYVSTLAGGENGFADGLGTSAMFRGPSGLCVGPLNAVDTLFVSDSSNHRFVLLLGSYRTGFEATLVRLPI